MRQQILETVWLRQASGGRITVRPSRPHVVASAACFTLRLHASAAPPRVGLTQALGISGNIMKTASEVQEVIFAFTQRCFVGQKSTKEPRYSEQQGLFDLLSDGDLTVLQVHAMGETHRDLLRELLTQYIMFLQMNQHLSFPSDFLGTSDNMKLGHQLLEYICRHRWPFPQLQKQGSRPDA